ncbi:MAG: TetR/AcrR family transcriptional regulator C-terminal domain-containing protein [Lachnospiraceae bacterium]|nr:TetR/AcrR family transcriptional regulator C-terminal domain-containing protein [Lachnospiraceae bacterium]
MANFTEKAIKAAFLQLLEAKPLPQITVRDIVETCGINRNSFYYHYQDIPSLVEELLLEQTEQIIRTYPLTDSVEETFLAIVDYIESHRKPLFHLYHSSNRESFEKNVWKICDYVVDSWINARIHDLKVSEEDLRTIAWFYKCQCFGVTMSYMDSDMRKSAGTDFRNAVLRICRLHKGGLKQTLEDAEGPA